ncbi:MAG: hypothetical protein WBH21_04330, partial [Vibrio anguillarum]
IIGDSSNYDTLIEKPLINTTEVQIAKNLTVTIDIDQGTRIQPRKTTYTQICTGKQRPSFLRLKTVKIK